MSTGSTFSLENLLSAIRDSLGFWKAFYIFTVLNSKNESRVKKSQQKIIIIGSYFCNPAKIMTPV